MANNLVLSGTIYDEHNYPLSNVHVRAFDQDLRETQTLGVATTNEEGYYQITYSERNFSRAEKKSADVFIIITKSERATKELGRSPIHYNVAEEYRLDFKIDGTTSRDLPEFDQLVATIRPLLAPRNISIHQLEENDTHQDFSFLAGETGEALDKLELLPIAFRFGLETEIAPDIFYGLFRMSYPIAWDELFRVSRASIKLGLEAAMDQNIISTRFKKSLKVILQTFDRFSSAAMLQGSQDSEGIKDVIHHVIADDEAQQAFMTTWLAHEEDPEMFWKVLQKDPAFRDDQTIADLQETLLLHRSTLQQPALTDLLVKEKKKDADLIGLHGFAKFQISDWKKYIAKLVQSNKLKEFPTGIRGDTDEEKVDHYASVLGSFFHDAFPTSSFAARLKKDRKKIVEPSVKKDLLTFFKHNPYFNLSTNRLQDSFAYANKDDIDDETALKAELGHINRLHKLADSYDEVAYIRGAGYTSASDIVKTESETSFTLKMADELDAAATTQIYQKAKAVHQKAQAILMNHRLRHDTQVMALNGGCDLPADYEDLFGTHSLCQCKHCQSLYSPAAYFVDILQFLRKNGNAHLDANGNPTGESDLSQELHTRRPDLKHILLSCHNTNTPLPYIDLVNEMLENTIQPPANDAWPQTTWDTEVLSTFPEHINQAVYDVIKTDFSSLSAPFDLHWEEQRLALDKLGLSKWKLIELFHMAPNQYELIGVAAEILDIVADELPYFYGSVQGPNMQTNSVSELLRYLDLSYLELLSLLECRFIAFDDQDNRVIHIQAQDGSSVATCDVSLLEFDTVIDPNDKINRFIRLWRKTGWSMHDLDRALASLDFSAFPDSANTEVEQVVNTTLLIPLSHLQRLHQESGIPIERLCSLWSDISLIEYTVHSDADQKILPALFDQLFASTEPDSPPLLDQENLAGAMQENAAALVQGLGISKDDLSALVNDSLSQKPITISHISSLYRHKVLAMLAGISITDLAILVDLGLDTVNPFESSAAILRFLDLVVLLKGNHVDPEKLHHYLSADWQSHDFDRSDRDNLISEVKAGLTRLAVEHKKADLENLSDEAKDDLEENFENAKRQLVEQHLSDAFTISIEHLPQICATLIEELIKLDAQESDDDSDDVSEALHKAYLKPLRFLWILHTLDLDPEELIFFTDPISGFSLEMIFQLAADNPDLKANFLALLRWVQLRSKMSHRSEDWHSLFTDGGTESKEAFKKILIAQTQSSPEDLQFLIGGIADDGLLQLTLDDLKNSPFHLHKLLDLLNLGRRYDIYVESLHKLQLPDPDRDLAQQLLKDKFGEDQWLEVMRADSNLIRNRKRDALLAFIMHADQMESFRMSVGIRGINDLYAQLLIDVEMDACMMTSRLKQAIGSVQLFVDRCLLGIEPNVTVTPVFSRQWNQWRKQYRVWEANRKIFLYPENWIEPDLRDDKSPFFQELETKLTQNEITNELAKGALKEYLEKLDEVANLEIIGLFTEKAEDSGENGDVLHVFGRTHQKPHKYFYRKQLPTKNWTAWERVDLDIEGDHILPVVWNGRLMLFWGTFEEKQESQPISMSVRGLDGGDGTIEQGKKSNKYFEFSLVWSEHKNDRWGRKRVLPKINLKYCPFPEDTMPGKNEGKSNDYFLNRDFYFLTSDIVADHLFIRLGERQCDPDTANFHLRHLYCINYSGLVVSPYAVKNRPPEIFHRYPPRRLFKPPEDGLFEGHRIRSRTSELRLFSNGPLGVNQYKKRGSYMLSYYHFSEEISSSILLHENHLFTTNYCKHNLEIKDGALLAVQTGPYAFLSRSHKRTIFEVDRKVDAFGHHNGFLKRNDLLPSNSGPRTLTLGQRISIPDGSVIDPYPPEQDGPVPDPLPKILLDDLHMIYTFEIFYYPRAQDSLLLAYAERFDELFGWQFQSIPDVDIFSSEGFTAADKTLREPYPVEKVDFDFTGSNSSYNWELFYHIPMLIADRLNQNQRFEEARKWYHYIFDPTVISDGSGCERFWKTKPFRVGLQDEKLSITDLLKEPADLEEEVAYWADNPFNPHAVAHMRISAYMRSTFMKYVDNLIDWGDQLFTRDTIESINEATQLYILAANLLGVRPASIPARVEAADYSYHGLDQQGEFDALSNMLVEIETFLTPNQPKEDTLIDTVPYFCTPRNEEILAYWDRVADRLFKIRHCMNIQGQVRQLPLFEPPIDPALLVRARAAGLSIAAVLDDISVRLPNYRFQFMLQKAHEYCNDVKPLGAALLSALEKKDAEELSLLRSSHEIKMLELTKEIRKQQRDEAKSALDGLLAGRAVVEERNNFYSSRQFLNAKEELAFNLNRASNSIQSTLSVNYALASLRYLIPDVKLGSGFTLGTTSGGLSFGNAVAAGLDGAKHLSQFLKSAADMASQVGTYERRMDNWKFQARTATLELKQIDKQITAAEIRLAIAEREIENHEQQLENSRAADDYMRSKFTNVQLYNYMVRQLSSVYFQSYQMAYDLAKKAEACYRFELGLAEDHARIIQYGHWDSLKKGLLSGEKLQFDLRRLEMEYLQNNYREFELTKHISLRQLDPTALLNLKFNQADDNSCTFTLPEWIFDLDCPGHYMRRIKTVSLSIPAVVGPYSGINCKLQLIKNKVRIKSELPSSGYRPDKGSADFDDVFTVDRAIKKGSIVTSTGQSDSGVFELNHRDERYLPFEGAGVESEWFLQLTSASPQFDYSTISDVIIHLQYTARESAHLVEGAKAYLKNSILTAGSPGQPINKLFSLRHDFPSEWHRFTTDTEHFNALLKKEFLNYMTQGRTIINLQVHLWGIHDEISELEDALISDPTDMAANLNNQNETMIELDRSKMDGDKEYFLMLKYSLKLDD